MSLKRKLLLSASCPIFCPVLCMPDFKRSEIILLVRCDKSLFFLGGGGVKAGQRDFYELFF